MKTNKLLFIIPLFLSLHVQAQVTIGSEKSPEDYSVLELDSKGGGIRLNQLGKNDKEAVTDKLETALNKTLTHGLSMFSTEANKIQYWDGDTWAQVLSVKDNEDSEGRDGQFLMSNGTGKYPEWTTLNVPRVQNGDFYLYKAAVKKDMEGVDLPHLGNSSESYPEDLILNGNSKNWMEIKGLETTITIPDVPRSPDDPADKVYTRLAIEMQTGAQMIAGPNTSMFQVNDINTGQKTVTLRDNSWISFAIGIFIGNATDGYKLKQVRSERLEGSAANPFSTFTLIGAVDNLPPGQHTLKVAVKRRLQASFMYSNPPDDSTILYVGKPAPESPNFSDFMAQSFLRADLYVIYNE